MQSVLTALTLLAAVSVSASCNAAPTMLHYPSGGKVLPIARWEPEGAGRHPVIILLYGSAGPDLILNDPQYRRYPEKLAEAGFTVFMPYYFDRTGSKPHDDYTPQQFAEWIETVRDAVHWAAARNDVQPKHIGLLGLSLGAFLGLAVGTEEPRLATIAECYGGMPSAYVSRVKTMPPTLILHGQKDVLVSVEQAHKLEALFKEHAIPYEIHIYPEQNHGFMDADGEDSVARIIAFNRQRMQL
jgi:carboxymethylenebutenolidase